MAHRTQFSIFILCGAAILFLSLFTRSDHYTPSDLPSGSRFHIHEPPSTLLGQGLTHGLNGTDSALPSVDSDVTPPSQIEAVVATHAALSPPEILPACNISAQVPALGTDKTIVQKALPHCTVENFAYDFSPKTANFYVSDARAFSGCVYAYFTGVRVVRNMTAVALNSSFEVFEEPGL